jgi:hypothetical protein
MTDNRTPEQIEEDGFVRQTLVALSANMAAATIHSGIRLDWKQLVGRAMDGTKECWRVIQEHRNARNKSAD